MRIFSGIQPTGPMHIGNYLGAVSQWLELQKQHECFFCVVDLHAITVPQNPKELELATRNKVIELLATGISPEKCALFVQSQVPEHTELAWILNTMTPLGELERMTQFKDKAKKQKTEVFAGLFNYPVLMASDILLYKTQAVPVGQDQAQHLELTRTLAKKFNSRFGETFVEPKTILKKEGARIMSLKEPRKKMSKSDKPDSYLGIFEEPESMKKKIMAATTDTGKEIKFDEKKKPGISNLLTIYSLFSKEPMQKAEKKFQKKDYAFLKKSLAALLTQKLEPLRKKKRELDSRELYVKEILRQGQNRASSIAKATMQDVREKIGLLQS
ncbi:MAG: tryptophan--tRNA ligase [Candidatus Wildermuthbacteria bacterium RIFCSPHIGHO2_02_FULL_49_9]|uniref:Tryptophan--tRNA ligase n=2 Tax=Candidatus Wildermuthiibacteriota TaxID=1817923 RepID=A0A1G2QZN2_9BACT|nr:MAG: tryptophan--tRNA ligase [Candidatus Wildermuthbacteria bacterium RIFCSPHIGHO2_01_FULL_49_22b]OHA70495.1 MAG: tryptophan--tRNA ligase [Candidatus Wildermuthbacteria bacterium RIFCSPHIGHO2_02_FULL_49_9]